MKLTIIIASCAVGLSTMGVSPPARAIDFEMHSYAFGQQAANTAQDQFLVPGAQSMIMPGAAARTVAAC